MDTCPKCNAPLKPGAKFCTKCGTRVAPQPAEEVKTATSAFESDSSKARQNLPDDMQTATQRICWNILPGQVARVISEHELESYGSIRGIIVPEGTTAYIRAGGATIAAISGGTYDFEQPTQGFMDTLRRGWQTLIGLFKSRRKEEEKNPEKAAAEARQAAMAEQQRNIFAQAKAGAAFSIIILLNRAFPLLIGAKRGSLDEYANFMPMTIRTRYVEAQVGLNAYFRISDHEAFIQHFLTGRRELNTASLADEICESVQGVIQDVLIDYELTDNRVGQPQLDMVKSKLENLFPGFTIVRIVELSANSEDIERFVELSRELYLSEKELDFLRRTNDFKNRLATVQNEQTVHEARDEQELRQQLYAVNRDKLLSDDEMEKFVILLQKEKELRQARTEEERDAALAEIEKTRLLRETDLTDLRAEAARHELQAGASLRMMQLKDQIDFERVRMQGENEQIIEKARTQILVDQMRRDQEFEERRRHADLDFEQQKRQLELEAEANRQQMDDMQRMVELKEKMNQSARQHELEKERMELEARQRLVETQRDLTPEQLLAMQGGEASVEFARAIGARNSVEAEREANARYEAERQRNQDRLYDLMNRMVDAQAANNAASSAATVREQARADQAYDRALNYTTRTPSAPMRQTTSDRPATSAPEQKTAPSAPVQNAAPSASVQNAAPSAPVQNAAPSAPAQKAAPRTCPTCGAVVAPDSTYCEDCGEKLK